MDRGWAREIRAGPCDLSPSHGGRVCGPLTPKDDAMRNGVLIVVTWFLVASTALAQGDPRPDPLVQENATIQLAEHTYVIPDGNVGAVPNIGIVVGSRATLVIDPGLGRRNGETVLREVAELSDNIELYVASTHYHPEHTTGYVAFPADAQYVNSRIQEAEFAESGQEVIDRFSSRSPVMADLLRGVERRVADITFDREHRLDLGDVQVRLLVVGPTHTRGDTGFFVEGDGVLFSGDVVMKHSFLAANPASSITAWLAAFDAFEAWGPRTIVPAHGEVGDGSLIPTHRMVMRRIQARTRELKAEGRSVDEAADTVQQELQASYPTWGRVNGVGNAARAAYDDE